jgi:hypothetical protein
LFEIDPRTSRRWALGENERDIPEAVNIVLRLMLKHRRFTPEYIEDLKKEKLK